ncbi:MAG: hypothetical protein AAF525_08755 [Pseudomonadota bacterium]
MHSPRWITLAFIYLMSSWSLAETLQPGKLYPGGTQIDVPDLGIAITLPTGWKGLLPAGAAAFIMESDATQANLFLIGDRMTAEQLRQTMAGPIPLDTGVTITPSGNVQDVEGWMQADYVVAGQPQLKARIKAQTGTSGIAFAIIAIGDDARIKDALTGADLVARSVTFSEPIQPPVPQGLGGNWQDYMKGRYVVRLYTGSGYYEEEHIWLCSDGSFFRSTGSGGFGGGASGAFGGKGQGAWRAEGELAGQGRLVLAYGATTSQNDTSFGSWQTSSGPSELQYLLELADDKLYLDGKRWFRDGNERCR